MQLKESLSLAEQKKAMVEQLRTVLTQCVDNYSAFATDEFGMELDNSEDPYLPALLAHGECFILPHGEQGTVCDYPPGTCHASCADLLQNDPDPADRLFTGYALHDANEWFQHTFIVNNGMIVEPGSELFLAYFGVELKGKDREVFLATWAA